MDTFHHRDFLELLEPKASPCISIYMPAEISGRETRQNPIRLKNLLTEADLRLREIVGEDHARRILRPAWQRLEEKEFWNQRSYGLAVLITPEESHFYWLPISFEESVCVGDQYLLRPLLPVLQRQAFCYLLAVSQNRVRLLRVSEQEINEIATPGLPSNITDALNYVSTDRGAQVHSGMSGAHDKQNAVFHGQGGKPDAAKDDLREYARQIDVAVVHKIHSDPAPLGLACVQNFAPIYCQVTRVPQLLDTVIDGNPDQLTERQIHDLAWPLLGRELHLADRISREELKSRHASGSATSAVSEIVLAACDGRVETLLLDLDRRVWGMFRRDERIVDVHDIPAADDQELSELAAVEVFRHGGNVRCVAADQLATTSPMEATLRFA